MKNFWGGLSLFIGGVVFGTAGIKALSSDEAVDIYTKTTAVALRAKENVMVKVTEVIETGDDILAGAKAINDKRAEEHAKRTTEDLEVADN